VPERPLIFLKPPSALIESGDPIVLPSVSSRVEHEAEIAVVVGRRLRNVSGEEAAAAIGGIACANDVTARDLQAVDGQWSRAKGFDTFCPLGPVATGCDWRGLEIICRVNGVERQRGRSADMVFPIPAILAYIAGIMTLEPGDLVLTGTPAGVGPLAVGDVVEVESPGVGIPSNPVRKA
jgi:2-keto-4-pentenoate hydratase/2-oxohepta-3-ene-1,7-dioic acid hydratase in catechol pathway